MNQIGDLRVRGFKHPDGGMFVFHAEEYRLAIGVYAAAGAKYWANMNHGNEPFTTQQEAIDFMIRGGK
jgi:hypothetical protein